MANEDLSLDDLRSALAQQHFAPVYLFYGEEDFLAEEAIELVIKYALTVEQQGFNLDVVYGSDADARDIISHASSFPMLSERRVVVVRDLDKLGNKELLASYIEQPASSTSLVLHSSKPDFRKKPYITAKRCGTIIKVAPIREYQVAGWVSNQVRQQGHEIEPEAVKILAAYVGTSLRDIQNELDKLYIFIAVKRAITPDDIRSVVGVSKEYDVFELQNAIGARDLRRSTEILSRMLDSGESPLLIIVMLTRYFTALWKLHDLRRRGTSQAELAGVVGLNPYFIREYVAAAGNYRLNDLERSFDILTLADEQLKSSSIDPFQVMQNMIVYLVSQEELLPA